MISSSHLTPAQAFWCSSAQSISDGQPLDVSARLHYEQMNNQTLSEAFGELSFGDLLRAADCSPRFRQLAEKWMVEKFALDRRQIVFDPFENGPISSHQLMDTLQIHRYDFVLRTLRLYGVLITKLTLQAHQLPYDQLLELGHHIGRYTAHSLTELNLYNAANMFVQFDTRMPHVRNLRIDDVNVDDCLQLNVLFPQLERFDLKIVNPAPLNTVAHHYPHLRHFSLNELDWQRRQLPFVDHFMRLNPQIRSFASDNLLSVDSVELMKTYWPHLEWLSLADHPQDLPFYGSNEIVSIDSVRHFVLQINRRMEPIFEPFPLSFGGHLVSVEVRSFAITDDLTEFIMENERLRKISLPWTEPKRAAKLFQRLKQHFRELQEFEYKLTPKSNAKEMIELMADAEQLRRVTVVLHEHSDYDHFADAIPEDWFLRKNETHRLDDRVAYTFDKMMPNAGAFHLAAFSSVCICLVLSVVFK